MWPVLLRRMARLCRVGRRGGGGEGDSQSHERNRRHLHVFVALCFLVLLQRHGTALGNRIPPFYDDGFDSPMDHAHGPSMTIEMKSWKGHGIGNTD